LNFFAGQAFEDWPGVALVQHPIGDGLSRVFEGFLPASFFFENNLKRF
jgi:hypothetical protein